MKTLKSFNLRPGEHILDTVRADCVPMIPWIVFLFVWIATPFFFLFPLWHQGWLGLVLFFVLVASGILVALRTRFSWQRSKFVVTDERVIDICQYGFFDQVITEVELRDIEEVSYRIKGIISTVFRFGTVHLRTAGLAADIEVRRVNQPISLVELLNDLRHEINQSAVLVDKNKTTF